MKTDLIKRTPPSWERLMHKKHSTLPSAIRNPMNKTETNNGAYQTFKKVSILLIVLVSSLTLLVAISNDNGSRHSQVQDEQINHLRTSSSSSSFHASARIGDEISLLQTNLKEKERVLEAVTCEPPETWVNNVPAAALYIIIAFLVLFSAFFSGLTLALMGLDTTGLEIVMSGDNPKLSAAASRIYPIRKNGNLLLCTLLLGNVAVNTLLGILMADLTSGSVGFVSSTALIVIFGEIIPQATFSRYALQVGEKAVPIMKVIICIFYVLAKPLAFILDKVLGHELATVYSKAEMSKLLEIHLQTGQLNKDEEKAMKGALQYQDMKVEDVMTPLEKTFVINVDDKLNFETMATIFKTGYSRIPVYENNPTNIIGMLFVKDLIFVNPEDETPIRTFVDIFGRGANVVWVDDKLGEVLASLKKGNCHMALVKDVNKGDGTGDPVYEVMGIITLEDIIEVILGDEIIDETDAWIDGDQTKKVQRKDDFDWARLRLLDSKIVDQTLSDEEVRAVSAHLSSNFNEIFGVLSEKQILRMIAASPVLELREDVKEVNESLPSNLLYEKEMPADKCTLILSGKVTVIAGNDNFRSDLSSWSLLAPRALTGDLYVPDFSAYVSSGPCRCLQFSREIFGAAVTASELEAIPQGQDDKGNLKRTELNRDPKTPERQSSRNLNQRELPSELVEQRGKMLQKLLFERSTLDLGKVPETSELSNVSDESEEHDEKEMQHNTPTNS